MKSVATYPLQRVNLSFSFAEARRYDYGAYVNLNRFTADEFKQQGRYERQNEFETLFSQMYK